MRPAGILMGLFMLVGLSISNPALSQTKKKILLDPQGEPKGFHAGESVRYAVWHGKHGWHLRTTTAKKKHHFTGSIIVEGGTFEKAHSHHLEKEGKLQDHWKLDMPGRSKITFDFKTDGGIDGINFTISKSAKFIRFNLRIDGKHQAERIAVGRGNHHPHHDPFFLLAHPHKK